MNIKQRILILLEKYETYHQNYNHQETYKQKFIDDSLIVNNMWSVSEPFIYSSKMV